jgi:hypothetical protein
MRTDFLVVIKEHLQELVITQNDVFKPHQEYRVSVMGDSYIVHGVEFNKQAFEMFFDYVLDRAILNFIKLGLIVDGKPVSKSQFKKLADVHTYGKGKKAFRMAYFGHTKTGVYMFRPMYKHDNKTKLLDNAYTMFLDFLGGESDDFDCQDIQFGNGGVPVCMGFFHTLKKRYLDPNPKSIL